MRQGKIHGTNIQAIRGVFTEGLIVLDGSFIPIALDAGAESILGDLSEDGGGTLPPEIKKLLTTRPLDELDAASATMTLDQHEYGCRIFLMTSRASILMKPIIVLYLKREHSIMDAVRQAGEDYRLTDREQEALIGVVMGFTSKELAVRMDISPNTVKAFLRLIMIKMGVATRTAIVGKLLEENGRAYNAKAAT